MMRCGDSTGIAAVDEPEQYLLVLRACYTHGFKVRVWRFCGMSLVGKVIVLDSIQHSYRMDDEWTNGRRQAWS